MEEIGVNLAGPLQEHARHERAPASASVKVPEALKLLEQEEAGKLVDQDRVNREALLRAETAGIIFIDEIDKIASREGGQRRRPRRLAARACSATSSPSSRAAPSPPSTAR